MARKNEWQKGLKAGVKNWLTFNTEHNPTIWTEEIKKKLTSGELSYENYGDYFFNRSEKYIHTDVVREGLVCWLDGRDGSNAERTSVWRDRSGNGNDATLYNFDFTNSGWYGNGLKVVGNTAAQPMHVRSRKFLNINNALTIDMCICINTFRSGVEFLGSLQFKSSVDSYYSIGLNKRASSKIEMQHRTSDMGWFPTNDPGKLISASKTYVVTGVYMNSKLMLFVDGLLAYDLTMPSVYTADELAELLLFIQGFRHETGVIVGATAENATIYSAKVYNRALSQEEVLQNYNYEKSIQRG